MGKFRRILPDGDEESFGDANLPSMTADPRTGFTFGENRRAKAGGPIHSWLFGKKNKLYLSPFAVECYEYDGQMQIVVYPPPEGMLESGLRPTEDQKYAMKQNIFFLESTLGPP